MCFLPSSCTAFLLEIFDALIFCLARCLFWRTRRRLGFVSSVALAVLMSVSHWFWSCNFWMIWCCAESLAWGSSEFRACCAAKWSGLSLMALFKSLRAEFKLADSSTALMALVYDCWAYSFLARVKLFWASK